MYLAPLSCPVRYPKAKVAELYGLRWSVETHFAELKTTLRMRRVMLRAAERQGTTPDRVSFTDALRWLLSAAAPGEDEPLLVINPRRGPGRAEGDQAPEGQLPEDDPAAAPDAPKARPGREMRLK